MNQVLKKIDAEIPSIAISSLNIYGTNSGDSQPHTSQLILKDRQLALSSKDLKISIMGEITKIVKNNRKHSLNIMQEGTLRLYRNKLITKTNLDALNNIYTTLFETKKGKIEMQAGIEKIQVIYAAMAAIPGTSSVALAIANLASGAIDASATLENGSTGNVARISRSNKVDTGMVAGAIAGAGVGGIIGGFPGAVIGAVVGGIAGAAAGLCA